MKTRIMQIAVAVTAVVIIILGVWKPETAQAAGTQIVNALTLFTNTIGLGVAGAYGGATNGGSHNAIPITPANYGEDLTISLTYNVTNNGLSNIVAGLNATGDNGATWTTTPQLQVTNQAQGSNGPCTEVWVIPFASLKGWSAVSVDYFNTTQTNNIGVTGTYAFTRPY